jgi:peptidyl-prolyl cis-trans isomerase SurA
MDSISIRYREKITNISFSASAPSSEQAPGRLRFRGEEIGRLLPALAALCMLILSAGSSAAQERIVLDRIVAVADGMLITKSDVDTAAALAQLETPAASPQAKTPAESVITRLIEQRLIQREIQNYPGVEVTSEEVAEQLRTLDLKYRTAGGLAAMATRWHLSANEIEAQVLYQLRLAEFIDVRFRSFIRIEDEEIARYYADTLPAVLKKSGIEQPPPLDTVRERIREVLSESKLQQQQEQWIQELVRKADIQMFSEHFSLFPTGGEIHPIIKTP